MLVVVLLALVFGLISPTFSAAQDQGQRLRYYVRDDQTELVYKKGEDKFEFVDLYQFLGADSYRRFGCEVTAQSGVLHRKEGPGAEAKMELQISPWPAQTTATVKAADPSQRFEASGKYRLATAAAMAQIEAQRFGKIDSFLNSTYRGVIAKLPVPAAAALRGDQREWIKNRDVLAEEVARFNQGELQGEDEKIQTDLARSIETLDRIKFLQGAATAMVSPRITGTYQTTWGNELRVEEKDGFVLFELNGIVPRNGNMGTLSAKAKLKGRTIHWVDSDRNQWDSSTNQPAEVTIDFGRNGEATVDSKNDSFFHGQGVYFGGSYLRMDTRKPKIED